jgi:hypothetical protein
VAGAPVLSAAVRGMRSNVELGGRLPQAYPPVRPGGAEPGFDPGRLGESDGGLSSVRDLQREARDHNIELLLLQEATQRENREFQTLSNVMKAAHDTAKAAISNLHT